jgi:hypothetical protein
VEQKYKTAGALGPLVVSKPVCALANGLLYVFAGGYPSSTLETFNPDDGSLV